MRRETLFTDIIINIRKYGGKRQIFQEKTYPYLLFAVSSFTMNHVPYPKLFRADSQEPLLRGIQSGSMAAHRGGGGTPGHTVRRAQEQTTLSYGAVSFRAGLDIPRAGEGFPEAQRF